MNMMEIKLKTMDEIEKTQPIFRKAGTSEFKIRCPICGDSQKDPNDAHMYLKCSLDPSEPILYNCFKCNAKGKVTKNFLEKLGIDTRELSELDDQIFNKIHSVKKTNVDILTGTPVLESNQTNYITQRLGKGFSAYDYDKFKIIWDMNTLIPYITDTRIKNTLPSNRDSVSFLSDDKSSILTRFFWDDYPRWKKSKVFSSENKSFYTIKTTIDLLTKDLIVVNIAEGIFDILSVYKNFSTVENSVHIATLGSDYESGVHHAIGNGFIGDNIVLRIYIDSDIDEKMLKYRIKRYKWLFNKIYICKNGLGNDFGVHIKDIQLVEYLI